LAAQYAYDPKWSTCHFHMCNMYVPDINRQVYCLHFCLLWLTGIFFSLSLEVPHANTRAYIAFTSQVATQKLPAVARLSKQKSNPFSKRTGRCFRTPGTSHHIPLLLLPFQTGSKQAPTTPQPPTPDHNPAGPFVCAALQQGFAFAPQIVSSSTPNNRLNQP
jgi:hypothetical protein